MQTADDEQRQTAETPAETPKGEAAPSEGFAALYRRVGPRAYRLALSVTGDPAAAEDVVQEAFVRVWRRRRRLRTPESLDGYLLRAARNLACDHLRREDARGRALARQVRVVEAASAAADGAADPELVARALAALPPAQREVVTLRVVEGLRFREVAAVVDAPEGTVHSRFRYAVEKLRVLLSAGSEA